MKISLGSMLQLCNDTVLPIVCTERWGEPLLTGGDLALSLRVRV